MHKLVSIIFFTIISPFFISGQTASDIYKFTEDISNEIKNDTVAWKYQTGATSYSFSGDYFNALNTWDQGFTPRVYTPTHLDSVILETSVTKNAADYIVERSAGEQIIIINEAHHNSKHRTFTRSLLEGLYRNGYRYLGLEALSDSLINQRGYAVGESGYYTAEPEFGNLIYEAKRLGFVIFGYEAVAGKNGKEREIEQAKNIQQFLEKNRDGKLLIHCGFDHVYEKEVGSWEKAMAGRLKEYTGIDPFTIDQVKYTERSKAEYGHYFLYATEERQPFVLTDQNNRVFNGLSEPKQTDIIVIHPITDYSHHRPDWLAAGKKEYWFPEEKLKKYDAPVQVLVYRSGEYENNGIPADITELGAGISRPLYLQHKNYMVVVKNKDYMVIDTFPIVVE